MSIQLYISGMKRCCLILISIVFCFSLNAQAPRSWTSAEILQGIKKLNVLGSVLYLAAHPDDENTRLMAYFANEKLYRTGYLSLTRGDGGQNLIGEEQGIELGLIRTQELLAARRIDGGEQFFTRAFDFGFSKNPEETFSIWNKQLVLSDVVWVIRKFQPDVIITRFPTTGEGGHGHHTASAILANEAFKLAADPKQFPEQLEYVKPWQAKRILWNTFNFGGTNTTSPDQFKIDAGGFNPFMGLSYGEIAAISRSEHKSQGFGTTGTRGESIEYLKNTGGDAPVHDLMDGVHLDWSRVGAAGKAIEVAVKNIEQNYSVANPSGSVKALVDLYKLLGGLPDSYWKKKKQEEVQELVKQASGLFIKATSLQQKLYPGENAAVTVALINRGVAAIQVQTVAVSEKKVAINKALEKNKNMVQQVSVEIPFNAPLTQPYWLKEKMAPANYTVSDQLKIGVPDAQPAFMVAVKLTVYGVPFSFDVPVQYNFADPVKGELYEPAIIAPRVTVQLNPKLVVFDRSKKETKNLELSYSGTPAATAGYGLQGLATNATKAGADTGKSYLLEISNAALDKPVTTVSGYLKDGDFNYHQALRSIHYDHIPYINYFFNDSVKILNIDLKTSGKRIGYIAGAGDKIPEALLAMGFDVAVLDKNKLLSSDLSVFDAIVTGVRAYNVHEWLNDAYPQLMRYVKNGGNLIVQYNTNNNNGPIKAKIGPYNFDIVRTRVTDEKAAVNFVDPNAAVLNWPNKITQQDFDGWVQERSTYHAANWEADLKPVLKMHDPGEGDDSGGLLIGKYGKGYFTYSGLVFFRQLPAGVPGAFRLFANIIALNSSASK